MANLNKEERAALKEMSKVPLKELSLEHITLEQKSRLMDCARELDRALRAYYNKHQATGCDFEL